MLPLTNINNTQKRIDTHFLFLICALADLRLKTDTTLKKTMKKN